MDDTLTHDEDDTESADLAWKYEQLLDFTRKAARRGWLNTSGTAAMVLSRIGERA